MMRGMTALDPASIHALLDAGDLEAARAELAQVPRTAEGYTVVRVKLELYDGTLPPLAAIQQLVQLMRKTPDFPGAKELYQEASNLSYRTRQSSPAHSHPPPAVDGDDEEK
jgi:thioredoxin-like negative regulator of GroEL